MAPKQGEKKVDGQARQGECVQPLFVKLSSTPPAKKP